MVVVLLRVLWLWPVYGISFVFNLVWYSNFFALGLQVLQKTPMRPTTWDSETIGSRVADILVKLTLTLMLLVMATLFYFIPVIGPLIAFVLTCLLYAFYAFDYRWDANGWKLEQRLDHFHRNYSFFVGFGMPITILSFFMPFFLSNGIFAFLFPLYSLLAIKVKPDTSKPLIMESLPIFRLPFWIYAWLKSISPSASGSEKATQEGTGTVPVRSDPGEKSVQRDRNRNRNRKGVVAISGKEEDQVAVIDADDDDEEEEEVARAGGVRSWSSPVEMQPRVQVMEETVHSVQVADSIGVHEEDKVVSEHDSPTVDIRWNVERSGPFHVVL